MAQRLGVDNSPGGIFALAGRYVALGAQPSGQTAMWRQPAYCVLSAGACFV
jgi:hypothetical protein